jgi:hypothetical protein
MNTHRTRKKNLIVSYKNLSEQLKELFMERYPDGYKEHIQRFEKPNGEIIFVVPMETDDTVYMIKFDVKIDTTYTDDDSEKDYFDEEVEKAETQFAPIQEALEKEEEDPTHRERVVRHGSYDDTMENGKKRTVEHGSLGALGAELQEAFSDDNDDEEYDDYDDKDERDSTDPDDDYEPTDEELMDVDSEVFANAEIPPEELARMAAEELVANEKTAQQAADPQSKRPGRPSKETTASADTPSSTPKKKGRPRIKRD